VSKLIGELNEKYGRSKIEEFFARNFYQRLDKDQIKELKNKEIDIQNISKNRIIYNNYFQGNNIYNHQQNNYVQVYQQILSEANHQISQSLAKSTISPQEKKIINQTIIYLGTKEIFLNYRQEIITDLINSYCRLVSKNKFGKFANHATQLMNISSKLAGAIPGGTVAQSPLGSLGIIISLAQATSQEKDLKKYLKKLQEIFDKDQEALDLFDDSYRSLTDSIQFNNPSEITKNIINTLNLDHTQLKPFGNDQNIYKLSGF
jgi:hypothetical protein